ncbi:MAG TPA: glutathione S-transferase family protein [Burkholderiaceae bacterium]|nr:glutathione S-transferase family protein [Burkholderiaceae bacterium]
MASESHPTRARDPGLVLVSHALCPYVQRAAIVLGEKAAAFERRDVDLAAKPDWFLAISPLGRTPVLRVGDASIFESAVICEYLDETIGPRLHPADPLRRATHRAWMQFGSEVLDAIGAFYSARDDDALDAAARRLRERFERVEAALGDGDWFDGDFGMVDAVFGPVFRYFDVFDGIGEFGILAGLPRTARWRRALAGRPSVRAAAHPRYPELLRAFVAARGGALARRAEAAAAAA